MKPDWTTAPEWAQWWAVDENGMCCWYQQKPQEMRNRFVSPLKMWAHARDILRRCMETEKSSVSRRICRETKIVKTIFKRKVVK